MLEFGWADSRLVLSAGSAASLVQAPPPGAVGFAAGVSHAVAAEPGSAVRLWEAVAGPGLGLLFAAGLAWGPKPEARRFVRTRAEAESALAWAGLPCIPLGEQESISFRQRWRERHLTPGAFRSREPGKPKGTSTGTWKYDWESLREPEPITPELAAARIRGDHAVFFEAADLPVYLVPKAYWEGGLPVAWPCDVYAASYPGAGETAAFDHEGLGPVWSKPR